MWGFIINGIQSAGLEWRQMKEVTWDGATSEFQVFFELRV